jgi:hypothetical protein
MIPGTLPEPRRRRLAPVPCNTRLLALISICIIFSKMWITRDQMIPVIKTCNTYPGSKKDLQ